MVQPRLARHRVDPHTRKPRSQPPCPAGDGIRIGVARSSSDQTGSNPEISQRPPTLSRVTRTLDAELVGASWPTMTVWFTNTRTTAWLAVADFEAAPGTVATAEICFCLAPGITTSWVSFV